MPDIKFYTSDVLPIVQNVLDNDETFLLVKDVGIYLIPRIITNEQDKKLVAYAIGCNPNTDADWQNNSNKLIGCNSFIDEISPQHDMIQAFNDFEEFIIIYKKCKNDYYENEGATVDKPKKMSA